MCCDACLAPVSLYQSKVDGWARPGTRKGPSQAPSSQASLSFHLVHGSFQTTQANAQLQPPQEVVGCSDQDMQLLIHKAIQGGGFSQTAPGRQRRVREGPRSPPPSPPALHMPVPPTPPNSGILAWVLQPPTCCVTLGRPLYLSGSQL